MKRYKRVEVEFIPNTKEYSYPEIDNLPERVKKIILSKTTLNKRIIHFNLPGDAAIAKDADFIALVKTGMNACKRSISLHLSKCWIDLRKQMTKRKALLKDLANERFQDSETDLLKEFQIIEFPSHGLTTEIAQHLKPAFIRLIDYHDIHDKEAQALLLDILHGWFVEVKEIQNINAEALKKSFQRV
jgi:hypothetical protein